MTLITYSTRVHYANRVLEEALWSELEVGKFKRPLVLAHKSDLGGEMEERFFSGIPVRAKAEIFSEVENVPLEATARKVAEIYSEGKHDVLLAFGSHKAINLGKVARVAIAHEDDISRYSYARGGSRLIGNQLAPMIAAPGIDGIGSAITAQAPVVLDSDECVLMMCTKLIPPIAICDPSLIRNANAREMASAGADAVAHCVEALLSESHNPPAEGIAKDGLLRAFRNLPKAIRDDASNDARQEIVAACLNGALALQKGLGPSHTIFYALNAVSRFALGQGEIGRILLPGFIRFKEMVSPEKRAILEDILGVKNGGDIESTINEFFEKLPLPSKLSELSINESHIEAAADVASKNMATDTSPQKVSKDDYRQIMMNAF